MKKTYLAGAIAAISFAGVAQAQDYQMEAGLSYFDDGNAVSDIALDFTYHIETVNTDGRQLAEAYFLGRNSNVSANYRMADDDLIEDTMGLGVEWWFEDIYAAADFADQDGDNELEVRLGYMLEDGFLLYAGLNDDDALDVSTILVGTKYVTSNLNIEAEVGQGDDANDTVGMMVLADYYIDNNFSVGATVEKAERLGASYGVQTRYFFTPVMSGELSYTKEESNPDDEIMARFAMRF